MKKTIALLTTCLLTLSLLQGCGQSMLDIQLTDDQMDQISSAINESMVVYSNPDEPLFTDTDLDYSYDDSYETIVFSDGGVTTSDKTATVDGSVITINREKNYVVSGEIEEGQIIINSFLSYGCHLVLDGVSISNSTSAPILADKLDRVYITIVEGTKNYLTCNISDENSAQNACIYSIGDVTLNGNGYLEMSTTNGSAVYSDTFIKVANQGTYNIDADLDGFIAKDSISIGEVSINMSVGGSALVCETEDTIIIEDGEFKATSGQPSDSFSELSNIGVVYELFETTQNGDIEILDQDGNSLISLSPVRDFSCVLVASNKLDIDGSYTIKGE